MGVVLGLALAFIVLGATLSENTSRGFIFVGVLIGTGLNLYFFFIVASWYNEPTEKEKEDGERLREEQEMREMVAAQNV